MTNVSRTPGVERTQPPRRTAVKDFGFPEARRERLGCGLDILHVRVEELPIVDIQLLFPAGGSRAPADRPGLPALMASLLDEGTPDKSAQDIAATIERLGGFLGTGADWDSTSVEAEVLTQHFDTALELVAEIVHEPTFPQHEVDRLRRQYLAEITRRKSQPDVIANETLMNELYDGVAYAQPLIGTRASLSKIGRDDVVRLYEEYVARPRATLVATGDLEFETLATKAERLFDGWSAESITHASIKPKPLAQPRVVIVDRPGAAQTEIQIGQVGISRNDPRFLAAAVVSALLGGKFTSRLNLNLREKHGFTYGVRSRFHQRIGPAPFVISTALDTDNVGAALTEIRFELDRLITETPSPAEVAETQDYLIGSFPYTIETVRALGSRLRSLAVFDLPLDTYTTYATKIRALTSEDLLATAREVLDLERLCVVCVGPAEDLERELSGKLPGAHLRVADAES